VNLRAGDGGTPTDRGHDEAPENSSDTVLLVIILPGFALCAVTFTAEYRRWEKAVLLDRGREAIARTLHEKRMSVPEATIAIPSLATERSGRYAGRDRCLMRTLRQTGSSVAR
jgi:hypothetical protein